LKQWRPAVYDGPRHQQIPLLERQTIDTVIPPCHFIHTCSKDRLSQYSLTSKGIDLFYSASHCNVAELYFRYLQVISSAGRSNNLGFGSYRWKIFVQWQNDKTFGKAFIREQCL
jgi:hypothetical protein